MTSKNLFFNIMKEDLKGKLGVLLMNCFVMLICFPIVITMQMQNTAEWVKEGYYTTKEAIEELKYYVSGENEMVIMVVVCFAIIIAFCQFSYLYQKSQVDFYHSLPVSRTKYFFTRFINGILVFFVPFLLFTMIGVGILCASQFGNIGVVKTAALGIVVHMIGFVLCYATTILAICMTGNPLTGILGTAVFHGYGIALAAVIEAMMSRYSECYMPLYDPFCKISCHLTPIWMYLELGSHTENTSYWSQTVDTSLVKWMLYCVVITIAITVLAFIAFKKRKSETAGKSMAFAKSKPVIKVFIMVIAATCASLMFWSMSDNASAIWELVGFILGLVLSHILIQTIYEMDIKAIVKGIPTFIIATVLSIAFILGFRVGGTAYDNWEVNWEKVESVAINTGEIYGYYTQGSMYDPEENRYMETESMIFEQMKFSDKALAEEFVKACMQTQKEEGRSWSMRFQFTYKNGRKVYRQYFAGSEVISEYMPKLMADEEFRKGINSVFWVNPATVDAVRYCTEDEEGYNEKSLEMNKEEIQQFIETYKEEYIAASLSQINDQAPVYALQLYNHESATVLTEMYVYPSMEKTMEVLQTLGLKKDPYEGYHIKSIGIQKEVMGEEIVGRYGIVSSKVQYKEVTYTKEEKIQDLSSRLAYDNMAYLTNFDGDYNIRSEYSVWVVLEDEAGNQLEKSAAFTDEIPEWVKEDIEKAEVKE